MPYCTQPDFERLVSRRELLELTDRDEPRTGQIDVARFTGAVASADAIIDAHLRSGGYVTPVAAPTPEITVYSCAIARYTLHANLPLVDGKHIVQVNYDAAMAALKRISEGAMRLALPLIAENVAGGIAAPVRKPIFGDEWARQYDVTRA